MNHRCIEQRRKIRGMAGMIFTNIVKMIELYIDPCGTQGSI